MLTYLAHGEGTKTPIIVLELEHSGKSRTVHKRRQQKRSTSACFKIIVYGSKEAYWGVEKGNCCAIIDNFAKQEIFTKNRVYDVTKHYVTLRNIQFFIDISNYTQPTDIKFCTQIGIDDSYATKLKKSENLMTSAFYCEISILAENW